MRDDTEKRSARLIVNKDGRGSSTFRATLPQKWIRSLGLDEDNRDLTLEYVGDAIVIKKARSS